MRIRRSYVMLLLLALAVVVIAGGARLRPFRGIDASDIAAVSVRCLPPGEETELTQAQIEEIAELLPTVVIYQKDDSGAEYAGQSVTFTMEKTNGETITVTAFAPFLEVDGVWYRAKQSPCEALSDLGNRLIEENA